MPFQTRFLQGLVVDDYDVMGSQDEKNRKTLTIRTENIYSRVHWYRSKLIWTLNRDWNKCYI
jgi:hypothetical protein